MDTSGKLLMSHISDVLDITKYDAGKLQLRPVVMNLGTLLQDIVDSQSGAASAKNTTLTWGWSGTPADWIFADKERIQHVLMNVIGNAVKFTTHGQISVEATVLTEKPQLRITVTDTGIGMSAALKAQIFDDFLTGDSSYDREVGGTGLGLGIALRFVNAMSGTIDVTSEEGGGSTFVICLPHTPALAPTPERPSSENRQDKKSAQILLVEDNEINRVVAREMLTALGHVVTEAHNGQVAVDLAQQGHFDLILMDISMPVMDGRTATRAIRASQGESAETPIVALTANAMAEEQTAFLSDGMNRILTKPLSREGLEGIIAELARKPASQDRSASVRDKGRLMDPRHLIDLREILGPQAIGSLLARFKTEGDATVRILCTDLPLEEVAQLAHRIAGSAATLGAMGLRDALIRIEEAAKRHNLQELEAARGDLPAVWAATKDAMPAD